MNKQLQSANSCPVNTTPQYTETVLPSLIKWFNKIATQYTDYRSSRKAIRELTNLDSRMLKDIGIVRADVIRVAMVENPGRELERLNNETRNRPQFGNVDSK